MAYQNVEARFAVQFGDAEDARVFATSMAASRDCLRSPEEKAFEVDMTEEKYVSLGNRLASSDGGDTVELRFYHEFDVNVNAGPGYRGARDEPPSSPCVEDYVVKNDVIRYLMRAMKSCGVSLGGGDIECLEYESDSEEEIISREEEECGMSY